jgi:glycosyltransferase involved in cell wall biosynthesis
MRLNPKKRPLALVRIVRRLGEMLGSSSRIELRIAGDGPWRARLQRAIEREGLSRQIALLGHQSREQLRALFADSDVFVLPTVRESFGLAALEARCAGLPVVAMRGSGVSELVQHGVHGLLGDSDAELASHVATLIRDPAQRAAIADENRRSDPLCDWSRVIEQHVSLYSKAIALRNAGGWA